jgi:hypothetical protein
MTYQQLTLLQHHFPILSLFDYGDINLQVLASGETFTFQKVPRPTEVAGIISNLIGSQKT